MATISSDLISIVRDIDFSANSDSFWFRGELVKAESNREAAALLTQRIYSLYHCGKEGTKDNFVELFDKRGDQHLQNTLQNKAINSSRTCTAKIMKKVIDHQTNIEGYIVHFEGLNIFVPNSRILTVGGSTIVFATSAVLHYASLGYSIYLPKSKLKSGNHVLRVYRYADSPSELLSLWGMLSEFMTSHDLQLQMKVLTVTKDYPRNDAMVVYLPSYHLDALGHVVKVLKRNPARVSYSTFAKQICEGVSVAWDPQPFSRPTTLESFGQHRSRILADSIIEARGHLSAFEEIFIRNCMQENVDYAEMYRNKDSITLPISLESTVDEL